MGERSEIMSVIIVDGFNHRDWPVPEYFTGHDA